MTFSQTVKERALVACGRHCCLCHRFCGLKIELHHIQTASNDGPDTFENCVPLCFDCHADMRSYDHMHPKGTKYSEHELILYRNSWYNKVESNTFSASPEAIVRADAVVAKKILSMLPWSPTIRFLTEHDFLSPFLSFYISDITKFDYERDNPEYEFLDADLEASRAQLVSAIWKFRELSITYNFPLGPSSDLLGIPKELESSDPKKRHQSAQELNAAGKNVGEVYKKFVRSVRLKIPSTFIDDR